jgi:2-C-methyl-D-erythritol 4-phosphate cytidylyltransferase
VAFCNELGEVMVAKSAGSFLDGFGLARFARTCNASGHAGVMDVEWDFETKTESLHEGEISVCLVAAQAVVNVNGRQAHAERVARQTVRLVKQEKHGDGVRASGYGSADAVAGAEVFAVQHGHRRGHRNFNGTASKAALMAMQCLAILYTSLAMRVFVILPAAGIGTRMSVGIGAGGGSATPKQFLSIAGVPVLVHCLHAFLAVERVEAVYVAVRKTEIERVRAQVAEYKLGGKVAVVEGGDIRQQSVTNALNKLVEEKGCGGDEVILVHDAARPLIDPATIDRTIDAVAEYGAAIVALPAVDTIKQVERTAHGAIVTATIPRERIVQAQTPQGARCGLLQRAFTEAASDEFTGTDEASVLERAGVVVAVVPGSAKNFKITQPGDIELAEFYLGQQKA